MKTSRLATLLTLLFLAVTSHGAWACAACYDAAGNEKMTKAASIGIGVMVVIMFAMLGSIVAVARHLLWRAKHPLPDYDELLSDDHTPQDPHQKS